MTDPETIWVGILSRRPDTTRETWHTLNAEEQAAVHAHLQRMATEEGWTEPQRISARAALEALADLVDDAPPPTE